MIQYLRQEGLEREASFLAVLEDRQPEVRELTTSGERQTSGEDLNIVSPVVEDRLAKMFAPESRGRHSFLYQIHPAGRAHGLHTSSGSCLLALGPLEDLGRVDRVEPSLRTD